MSWPFSPRECPLCRHFEPFAHPAFDDAGYEIVGGCLHPRIRMELFRFKHRDPATMERCPCFMRKRRDTAEYSRDPLRQLPRAG